MAALRLALVILLILTKAGSAVAHSLPSCLENPQLPRSECQKKWSVLVYMAADNNLFPYALLNIHEMESVPTQARFDVLAQVDGNRVDDTRRLKIEPSGEPYQKKTRFDFENLDLDSVRSPVLAHLPENSGATEMEKLKGFLTWAVESHPSEHYMVIVWGHGQGWAAPVTIKQEAAPTFQVSRFLSTADFSFAREWRLDRKFFINFGGIASSERSGRSLDIPSLQASLQSFQTQIGKPIDVYASDACLMQMLEVAYQVSDTAAYVVGSTQVQDYEGYPYRRLLSFIEQLDNGDEAYELGKNFPKMVQEEVTGNAANFFTISALNSQELQHQLLPRLRTLATAIQNYLREDSLRALEMKFVLRNVPAFEGSSQDFGVFLSYLELLLKKEYESTGAYSPAAQTLFSETWAARDSLNRAVLAYAYGSEYAMDAYSRVTGYYPKAVSLWLPDNAKDYYERRMEFKESKFYKDTRWDTWLDELYCPKSQNFLLNPCL